MRRRFELSVATSLAASCIASAALAHGGIVPPAPPAGGPWSGPVGPSSPGPASPGGATAPGPSVPRGPSTGSPGPSTGSGPKAPATGGAAGAAVSTGGLDPATLDSWEAWWHFNKDPFLDLKRAVAATTATSASDDPAFSVATGIPSRDLVREKVVPALALLLEKERANDIATGALTALARIGEPHDLPPESSAIPRIVRALGDPNQEISETAALALGILRTEAAIPCLDDLLAGGARGGKLVGSKEVPARTRAFAAYGLGLTAERAAQNRTRQMIARALVDALEDRRAGTDVQVAAAIGLSLDRLDVEPVESTSAPWISRQTLLRHLMRVHSEPERNRLVRAHAATALARLADGAPPPLRAQVVELLLGTLAQESKIENEVLLSAVQGLGGLAGAGPGPLDKKVRTALARVLDDSDPQARAFAMIALAEMGARSASGSTAQGGAEPSSSNEEDCRARLVNELLRGKSTSKPWAALALGLMERLRADAQEAQGAQGAPGRAARKIAPSQPVRQLLRDWFGNARGRAEVGSGAIALGLCREVKAAEILRAKLADTNEETGQGYVALALGMVGSADAAPALREIVKNARYRPVLLAHAAEGLALLGDEGASVQIASLLAEARGLAAQASLSGALGLIGDARSVEPLLRLVARRDLSASTRGLAAAALGRVADESLLPWSASISCGLNYRAVTASLLAGNGTGVLEIL